MCILAASTTPSTWRTQPPKLYKLVFRYTTEGKLLWEDRRDVRLQSSYGRQEFTMKLGWDTFDKPRHWPAGVHKMQVLLDGVEIGQSFFTIEPPPPPPPPPTPVEILQQPSVKFYAWETGRIPTEAPRYSIRFPQQSTGWVMCELTVRNLRFGQQDWTYRVTAQGYTAEGRLLWEIAGTG